MEVERKGLRKRLTCLFFTTRIGGCLHVTAVFAVAGFNMMLRVRWWGPGNHYALWYAKRRERRGEEGEGAVSVCTRAGALLRT